MSYPGFPEHRHEPGPNFILYTVCNKAVCFFLPHLTSLAVFKSGTLLSFQNISGLDQALDVTVPQP
jgi:hypothetical protein